MLGRGLAKSGSREPYFADGTNAERGYERDRDRDRDRTDMPGERR
jgi:hypothetical protein